MKWIKFLSKMTLGFLILTLLGNCKAKPQNISNPKPAQWITATELANQSKPNQWLVFQKNFNLESVPNNVLTKIATDTKYWLWVNDKMIIREGGLKWGPVPDGYYFDEINLSEFLKKGENEISILVWHFGKEGFTHKNSGRAGLYFDAENIALKSDTTWLAAVHPAFESQTKKPHPNYRLPESNIRFDARKADFFPNGDGKLFGFLQGNFDPAVSFKFEKNLKAVARPIPFWKDFGLKKYQNSPTFPLESQGDTLILKMPYNAQVTPYFEIEANEGLEIDIRTDNYRGGGPPNVRTEFVTRQGKQFFETPGWMNGHEVHYYFPKGIKIHALKYRETGYETDFAGDFQCDDEFYNSLWQKALRTLYITMRDNYMDCPGRERAQWWGDVVLEAEESYYALDRKSDLLTRKAILELLDWQRADSTIYSPIPAGNWNQELPNQMLTSVGYYGVWNYFLHTGDTTTLKQVYPKIKKYLAVWKTDKDGLVIPRKGGWTWGDWGDNKDMPIIFNGWYYLALQGLHEMSQVLEDKSVTKSSFVKMEKLKTAFNQKFWNGKAYRSPQHQGETDDRAQGLAVVSGIAPQAHFPAIRKVLQKEFHASPYMEKYILECLFQMGYAEDALKRMKTRFSEMVESEITTLWEGWEIGGAKWGGGTYNHAWSGGGLTLLSNKVVGIQPLEAGYRKVRIHPQMGFLKKAEATVETVLGTLEVRVEVVDEKMKVDYDAPKGMEVLVELD